MFLITLRQVAILLFYILCGFTLVKARILKRDVSRGLAVLMTYLFCPVYAVVSLSENLSIEKIERYLSLILSGTVFTVLLILLAVWLSGYFSKQPTENGIYRYMIAFGNLSYFGYPLVDAVFGGEILADFMMFALPVNVALSSYGYFILTRRVEKGECSPRMDVKDILKRSLLSPPMIGTWIGILLGLLPIASPSVLYDFLSPAAGCLSVAAMLLVGIVLAGAETKSLFLSVKAYLVALLKLVLIPSVIFAVAFLLLKIGLPREIAIAMIVTAALPSGMNVVVYPESVGLDSTEGARACFVSYILALITVPLLFSLMAALI